MKGRGLEYRRESPCRGLALPGPLKCRALRARSVQERGVGWPHLGLEAEDGDGNGHHSSDDHCNDDGFGSIKAEGRG